MMRTIVRNQEDFQAMCVINPERIAFGVAFTEIGMILDCYDHFREGLSLLVASYANCFKGCWDTCTEQLSTPNAILCANPVNKTMKLVAGEKTALET